jgi:hypothetical protein
VDKITQSLAAHQPWPVDVAGSYFRLLSLSAAVGVTVRIWQGGKVVYRAADVLDGFWVRPAGGFTRVDVLNGATPQDVAVVVGHGDAGYDRYSGSVSIVSPGGAHAPAAKAVSNASVVLLAAVPARKYLLIQNRSATLDLYVRCDGAAATADAACLLIAPGQSWEPLVAPTGEIRAIRASAEGGSNVHAIEA